MNVVAWSSYQPPSPSHFFLSHLFCETTKRHASWWLEVCTSFGRLGADCSRSEAQVGQVAQSWPASSSWEIQAQLVSLWGFHQTVISLGSPTSASPQSPSRKGFRRGHRRGASFGSSLVRVGRRKSTCEAFGGGSSNCPFQGESSSFGGANHCVQAFRRPSKEKSQSGGGCHFQSPRTEGGVREGSAGRRSTIAAIGGVAIPTHRGRSHVSHRVATQNRTI